MAEPHQPQFHPISMVAVLAPHIDGMLEASERQYATLQLARPKPYILDDYTTNRVLKVFTDQISDLWVFDEQLTRWLSGTLTAPQRTEVQRLQGQMKKLREVDENVLRLMKEVRQGTIEKQLAKPDAQLGMEAVFRIMKQGDW